MRLGPVVTRGTDAGGWTHGPRAARRWVATAALGGFAGAALVGCPSSSSSLPYTPYTGINFVSQAILAGVGCGTAGNQVVKYVVVVADPSVANTPVLSPLADGAPGAYATLVDCNTNGVFSALLTSPDGGATVESWIYAYDEADFQALQTSVPGFASCAEPTCPLSLSDVQAIVGTYSTYTTTCTATPESGDNVLASCLPLVGRQGLDAAPDAPEEAAPPIASASDGGVAAVLGE